MFELLDKALAELPSLMGSHDGWQSVHVTYHAPRVERIWRQWGENRILLHRIHPCDEGEALMHPWPSAVCIMSGRYEHRIGVREFVPFQEPKPPTTLVTETLAVGSRYEMTNRHAYHSVRPFGNPSDSIMVTGPLYKPRVVMPHVPIKKQQPLSSERFTELFEEWKTRISLLTSEGKSS